MKKGKIKHGQSRETGNIDDEKQSKYVRDTTMRKQTLRHICFFKYIVFQIFAGLI